LLNSLVVARAVRILADRIFALYFEIIALVTYLLQNNHFFVFNLIRFALNISLILGYFIQYSIQIPVKLFENFHEFSIRDPRPDGLPDLEQRTCFDLIIELDLSIEKIELCLFFGPLIDRS
jgi:hypothetical protein